MRILGLLFILCGTILCATFFLAGLGLPCIGVGALLCIAAGRSTPDSQPKPLHPAQKWLITLTVLGGVLLWYLATHQDAASRANTVVAPASAPHHAKPAKKLAKPAGSPSR